jgi:DNA-binding winged helix-turn-helix (wHTH) protein
MSRHAARRPSVIVIAGRKATTGPQLHLTPVETQILRVLLNARGRIVARDEIQRNVWGETGSRIDTLLNVYIHHLRRKFSRVKGLRSSIKTVRGEGHYIELSRQSAHSKPFSLSAMTARQLVKSA